MSVTEGSPGIVESSRFIRYGIAVLSVVAAVALRFALDRAPGSGQILFAFTLAIIFSARFGGRGPGLLASALCVLLAWYVFIERQFSFGVAAPREVGRLVILAITGAGLSLLIGRPAPAMHPARERQTESPFLWRALLFGSALLVLVVLTRLLYADFAREKDRQQLATHSYRVFEAIDGLMSNLQDAETGQRGYLLTGDASYLETFQSALEAEQHTRRTLRELTAGNPAQQVRLDAIDRMVEAKFSELQKATALLRQNGMEAALAEIRTGEGKRIMGECRALLSALKEEDRLVLARRTRTADVQGMRMRWALGSGCGSLLLLLIIAGSLIERDSRVNERARLALSQSQDRLRLALDAANAGTWEWDLKTNENVWSQELWKLYGLEPHSRVPSYAAWREVVHPDDRANAERVVAEAARGESELNVEFRVRESDGTERWLVARGRPLRNGDGRAARFVGIVMDVTTPKRAEAALRAREEDLRRFAEFAPVAIAMFDGEMRYLAASRRFRDDFCLGEQELIGRCHYDVFPEIPEHWREIHKRCLAGAVERHPGELFARTDGTAQWIRWEVQPWHHADGTIGGIVMFTEEITQEKRSKEALRESEAQFRTLANAIPQLCWIAHADGGIFWYNQRWYEYTGTAPEQMEGWGWQSVHDPVALPKVLERWKASIATGEPFDMVFPLRGADGAFRPFLTRVMPVFDRDGKVARWFGTNTDISQQQTTEDALRQASEQRRLALEAAELGAWDYRFDTGDVFWDDACCRMFSVPPGRISDDEAISRIHPEDRRGIREALDQALAGAHGGAFHGEFRVVWADGSVHWITSHGLVHSEVENGRRRPVRFIGVNMETTERKKAELEIQLLNSQLEQRVRQRTAQLETANKELEAFAYSVSHDLRAPLRGIDGWSLALAEDYAGQLDERAHQYIGRVRSEAQRMGLLIDDLLQLSRVTRAEMQSVPVNLTAIAQGIAARLQESHLDRRLEFVIEPGLTGTGDARLLEIALTNLLANAVKFTGPCAQARIEFVQADHNGLPVFCVRDNGVGFDTAYAHSLFRAFQRLHKASEFPGTGIGLATVQRVIQRHAGQVWAESQAGRGATFYFTIGEIA